MESHFQLFRRKAIKYYTCGKGDALFLIHGYQTDSSIWKLLSPLLSDKHKLIIPDLPGHGFSSLIQITNTMEFLAEAIYSIALAQGLSSINIAGHSMGGYVAMAFAEKYPKMINRLFLLNTHPFADNITKLLARDREADIIMSGKKDFLMSSFIPNNFSKVSRETLKAEISLFTKLAFSQPEKGMLADITGMMVRTDKTKLVQLAKCRIEFILGINDEKFPRKEMQELELPNGYIHWLENCGHMSLVEKPEEIAAIILGEK